ncbi:MAG TPA: hypothetical protein VJT13_18545 [Xanthobacteraceae bacterium]|nr:hypothetical protein [Xanthobacteraceae bacterium]
MDKLVKSVTVIRRVGDETEAVRIYQDPDSKKKRRKVSGWATPIERAARKLLKANTAFSEGMLRRTNKANRRRRDGWIFDAPVIVLKSGRDTYNQARKAVPFGIMPKA